MVRRSLLRAENQQGFELVDSRQKRPQQTLSHLVIPEPPFSPRRHYDCRNLCHLAGLLGPSGRPSKIIFLKPTVMVFAHWGHFQFNMVIFFCQGYFNSIAKSAIDWLLNYLQQEELQWR